MQEVWRVQAKWAVETKIINNLSVNLYVEKLGPLYVLCNVQIGVIS